MKICSFNHCISLAYGSVILTIAIARAVIINIAIITDARIMANKTADFHFLMDVVSHFIIADFIAIAAGNMGDIGIFTGRCADFVALHDLIRAITL